MDQKFLYKVKTGVIKGTSYSYVYKKARFCYNQIARRTKRRPYIKSAYFAKEKIFFDYFWPHLSQKPPRERFRRLKYFPAAIELLQKSRLRPESRDNPHVNKEILHRFSGATAEGNIFFVQIKEDKKTGAKYFMSCFPE